MWRVKTDRSSGASPVSMHGDNTVSRVNHADGFRHVKIPALNDSQYIGMSVYFVVVTSGIVVVLANLMPDRATLAFVTITVLILASTTATLTLLFLPQLANILAGERPDPVVQSFGLKIECNTRRFVTDDKR